MNDTTGLHCDTMGNPARVSARAITARYTRLTNWPLNYADAIDHDPRCGCGGDTPCWWDDAALLELL